ncbi:hypothetical protein HI914_02176 [Erysiphe necator]|nr:hypothetical protein HI914_02176 [Erysiphe necator]
MTEPLQRSLLHPMRTVIQPTSVFTPNMIKRHFKLRPKTIETQLPNPPSPNQNSKLYSQTHDYNTQSASQKPNRTIPSTHYSPINEETVRFPFYEIGNLTKVYREEDRYSGTSDSFDLCLGISMMYVSKLGCINNFSKDAFSIMLNGSAREAHFETAERQLQMISKWKSITLMKTIEENQDKAISECFELLVTEFRRSQLLLPPRFQGDLSLRDAIIDAVRDIRECSLACYKPAPTFEALCADIRAFIATEERLKNVASTSATFKTFPSIPIEPHDYQLYTDRRYKGTKLAANGKPSGYRWIQQYITECEDFDEDENEIGIYPLNKQFFTSYDNISGYKTLSILNDQSVRHALAQIDSSLDSPTINNNIKFNDSFTKSSPSNTSSRSPIDIPTSFIFIHSARYSDAIFQGVMIDTGAARVSTAGESQFRALFKIQKLQIDRSQAGQAKICFGIGTVTDQLIKLKQFD